MVCIIYGGSGGIGAALARRLAAAGRPLHLVARDGARLAAIARETGASTTQGDVRDPALFAQVAAAIGRPIDGLAYAVGSITLKPLARLSEEEFLADYRLNALGAAQAVQAALPGMARAETAAILLFSSVAVAQGFTGHASIAMAKGAVEGLTRALAAELAPKIRVNAIAPSLADTPLAAALTGSATMRDAIAQLHALRRIGQPEDIAALAALLLSPESGWISGQVIGVDGGRSRLRSRG